MLEIILGGIGVAFLGALAGYLIREGMHRREHIVIKDTFISQTAINDKHDARFDHHENRLDEHDVVNATILTSLAYIQAGIDEIKKEVKN